MRLDQLDKLREVPSAPAVSAEKGERGVDTIYGLRQIASYIGTSFRTAKHRAEMKDLPTFRMGKTVCGSRKAIDAWLTAKQLGGANG